jgi:hypothetical protein
MVTPRVRWLIAIAMLVGGAAVGAVVAWVILTRPFAVVGDGDGVVDDPPASFSISGDLAEPFFPGGSAPLDLAISNPLDTDLVVSDLIVEVDAVEAPNATSELPCTVDDFAVEQLAEPEDLVVTAGSTTALTDLGVPVAELPQVLMLDTASNQDGCKGASFTLTYSAVGRIVE